MGSVFRNKTEGSSAPDTVWEPKKTNAHTFCKQITRGADGVSGLRGFSIFLDHLRRPTSLGQPEHG